MQTKLLALSVPTRIMTEPRVEGHAGPLALTSATCRLFTPRKRGGCHPRRPEGKKRMFAYRPIRALFSCAVLAGFLMLAGPAWAQASQHLRGTLTAVQGQTLSVQTARGNTETVKMADDARLFLVTKADMDAIKSGRFAGITSVEQGGKRVAR